jgi:hypothetical protein
LIDTIGHNLVCEPDDLRLQRKVSFEQLSPEGVVVLERFAASRGQAFLEELDRLLAPYQVPKSQPQAAQPEVLVPARLPAMVGLGMYVFNTRDSE